MSLIDETQHIPKFGGSIWYVDGVSGNDSNSGATPNAAFVTIGAAITAASAGDAINVMADTYTETGLDMNKASLELWFEIGTIIDPVSGTSLTVSGAACRIKGEHKITPAAGQIGILVSGAECVIANSKVLNGGTGIQVTGSGVILNDCALGFQTATSFDLQGAQGRLYRCKTVGNAATYGYKISNSADTGVLQECTSVGHQTAGYFIDTGSSDWTLLNCSSGVGDGRWADTDDANVWSNFSFADEVYHRTTFTGGAGSSNLFKVTGTAEIQFIFADVETALAADVGNLKIELYDGAATNITTNVDVSSAPVNSFIAKTEESTKALKYYTAASAMLIEKVDLKKSTFSIVQKNATSTYIRATWDGNAASGVIHWHCQWIPLTETGFIEAV